jgi:hypothetical protein
MFMNELDVEDALSQYEDHDVLGPAVTTLHNLMQATNACSDGWAYWPKPQRAANKLMELVQRQQKVDRERYSMLEADRDLLAVTEREVHGAYGNLKAFRTREKEKSGIWFTIVY